MLDGSFFIFPKLNRDTPKRGGGQHQNQNSLHFKFKASAQKYMRRKLDALKEAKPGKAFSILKSMGAQQGEDSTFTFILLSHQTEGLTDKQSAERMTAQ